MKKLLELSFFGVFAVLWLHVLYSLVIFAFLDQPISDAAVGFASAAVTAAFVLMIAAFVSVLRRES